MPDYKSHLKQLAKMFLATLKGTVVVHRSQGGKGEMDPGLLCCACASHTHTNANTHTYAHAHTQTITHVDLMSLMKPFLRVVFEI